MGEGEGRDEGREEESEDDKDDSEDDHDVYLVSMFYWEYGIPPRVLDKPQQPAREVEDAIAAPDLTELFDLFPSLTAARQGSD
jgi:hypothetical protein